MGGGGGGIFNNRLLFSLMFSGNFVGDKALMEGDKVVVAIPQFPTREKIVSRS